MNDCEPILVVIRNPEGRYLTQGDREWSFTDERQRAIVFDFQRDHIAEHLRIIRRAHGPALEAVTIEPSEIHEICDACKESVKALDIFFDGRQFLCSACYAGLKARLAD